MRLFTLAFLTCTILLSGCVTSPATETSSQITKADAKQHACPAHILKAGASAKDCECAAAKLYELGKDGTALAAQDGLVHESYGAGASPRDIEIGLIRLEAFEACGFFKPGHPVNENLGKS